MRLLTSMASKDLLADLVAATGLELEITAGGGVLIADQVRTGADADLVVLASGAIARLLAEGAVCPQPVPLFVADTVLAVATGAVGATGASVPDISTIAALQQTLTDAAGIGYSTGPSGDGFLALLDDWGLREVLADRLIQARPGVPVGALIASGEVSIGIQQRPELQRAAGVQVLGPLPGEAAITTTFTGAVLPGATDPDTAAAALAALTELNHADIVRTHGMEPAPR